MGKFWPDRSFCHTSRAHFAVFAILSYRVYA